MSAENTYELIERYLSNDMDVEERMSFETRLAGDEFLREELSLHKAANELIVDNELLRLEQELAQIHTEQQHKGGSRGKLWQYLLVAAVIGTALVLLNTVDNKETLSLKDNSKIVNTDKEQSGPYNRKGDIQENEIEGTNKQGTSSNETVIPKSIQNDQKEPSVESRPNEPVKPELPVVENADPDKYSKGQKDDNAEPAPVDKCKGVSIPVKYNTIPTCKGQMKGEIHVERVAESGYLYSIDNGKSFHKNNNFPNLKNGNYVLLVKDKNSCLSDVVNAMVEGENCDGLVIPARNKNWDVPVERMKDEDLVFKIIEARSGKVVLERTVSRSVGFTWNGTDMNGTELPMGVFTYQLYSATNPLDILIGQVTIAR